MNSQAILVRGVNWLGDAVMTTPALLRLREAQPEARICVMTDVKLADLWHNHPAVNSVLTFTKGESIWSRARRLRKENFQLGLVLPNSARSALELWLAGIPRRIGYARGWRSLFLTAPIPTRPQAVAMRKRSVGEIQRLIRSNPDSSPTSVPSSTHQIFDYLHLVRHLGASSEPMAPFLAVGKDEVEAVQRRWPQNGSSPIFGLNPGAEYGPAKRWPKERFIAAAVEIHKQTNCRWIIFGGKSDVELANEIAGQIKSAVSSHGQDSSENPAVLNLAGVTTLRELCVLLKTCRLLLTNDTGPAHLAAAVGTPVVVLFGSTSPELTGPGLPGDERNYFVCAKVACTPCFLRECPIDFRCMSSISVKQVVSTVLEAAQ
jgi:heptosyltransferase-2